MCGSCGKKGTSYARPSGRSGKFKKGQKKAGLKKLTLEDLQNEIKERVEKTKKS